MLGNENDVSGQQKMASTKLCHIVKRPDFEGYGFNLHSEKIKPGQFIGKVDVNSPAEAAGLKEGDRIIEVNGVAIDNETHKQVVQRIKAISCEVRLLVADVDTKGNDSPVQTEIESNSNMNTSNNANIKNSHAQGNISSSENDTMEYHSGTIQELPGASANISSISMISTKRVSSSSSNSQHALNVDEIDKASITAASTNSNIISHNNDKKSDGGGLTHTNGNMGANNNHHHNNNNSSSTNNGNSNTNNNDMNIMNAPPPPSISTIMGYNSSGAVKQGSTSASTSASTSGIGSVTSTGGGLQLPMTAAEMRAKLLSKKKYDPKSESVDLKKKFDIIQKL